MAFVPFVPPPGASARARDLARQLESELYAYRREHPNTSEREVREALHLLMRRHPAGAAATRLALALGVAAAVLALFFFASSAEDGLGERVFGSGPFVVVALGALLLVAAVLFGIRGGLGEGEQRPAVLIVSGVILLLFLGLVSFLFLAYR